MARRMVRPPDNIVLCRYGEHEDDRLTQHGRATMWQLAERLKMLVPQDTGLVLGGGSERIRESVTELALALKIVGTYKPRHFTAEEGFVPDLPGSMQLILEAGKWEQAIFVVLPREYANSLASYYRQTIGLAPLEPYELEMGEAVIVSGLKGDATFVRI